MKRDFSGFIFQLFPHRCPLCLTRSSGYLCGCCQAGLPSARHVCPVCALPLAHEAAICGDCLTLPKPYQISVCPLLYQHPVDTLVHQFKNRQPLIAAHALVPPLLDSLHNCYQHQPWPSALVPVPSHWRARLRRGFNQAHSLADLLGHACGIPVKPWVQRTGSANPQKALDRKTRFANLRETFICPRQLEGEHLAVVDDVITTCATATLMTRALQQAGAGRVDIWALARTPKSGGF